MSGAVGFLWPTENQMLLLRAALVEGNEAREAFERWCDVVDLSGPLDVGALGLLPLVHANLASQPCELPHAGLIAGVRRRSFVEAQRAINAAGQALARLATDGVPTMVTKGIPLALAYYATPGLRPMADADILVEQHRAEEAIKLLETDGWTIGDVHWARRRRNHMALRHAVSLRREPGSAVDLHWRPLHEKFPADAQRQLWSRAVPIAVGGATTLCPDPTSLLMHVLLHGLRRNAKAPLRWITDAHMILRKDRSRIDWAWLIAISRRARMLNRLGLALCFLHDRFEAAVPADVLEEIGRSGPSLVERLENRYILGRSPAPLATKFYQAAMLVRLLGSEQRAIVPGLLWRKVMRYGAVDRA